MQKIKKQFDMFVETGELKMLFPGLTGNWDKDKERFMKLHEQMSRAIDIDITLKEEDGIQ